MTTIELDRPPAPQAPAPGAWWFRVDLAARAVLLLVLGVLALSLLPAHLAASRPAAQFSADLRVGRVTSIDYVLKSRSLRWSDGGIRWYAADLGRERPALGPSPDGMGTVTEQVEGNDPQNDADAAWIAQAIDAAGSRQHFGIIDSSAGSWSSQIPWVGVPTAASIAVILSFFLMLGRDRRRYGTRWAWFWVFAATSGTLGPVLYLLLEPAPLWRRTGSTLPARPRLSGGQGLAVALVLKGCLVVAVGQLPS